MAGDNYKNLSVNKKQEKEMFYIFLYNLINIILFPAYLLILLSRLFFKKENIASIKSRFALYKQKRPSHKLIWIHAASVGESLMAITLITALEKKYQDIKFLITTGTISSADIIAKRKLQNVYHEFTPLENWLIVKKFYEYWQPDLGIFIESELWPTLLSCNARKCKLLLLNARLSDKSFRRWQKLPNIFGLLTGFFTYIAVQSIADLKKYQILGRPDLPNLGNLKFANKKLEPDNEQFTKLKNILAQKKSSLLAVLMKKTNRLY